MIVFADTSPINHLILSGKIELLPKLYAMAAILPTARAELVRLSAPDALFAELEPGERDAILPAAEFRENQQIAYDRPGRREAERRGIAVMKTLRVLQEAATR
jgi:predicted nucleic acid-binding protein